MPIPGLLRANRNIRNIGQEKNPPVAVMSVVAVEALAFEWSRVLLRHHGVDVTCGAKLFSRHG
jgi:hypothetical protein